MARDAWLHLVIGTLACCWLNLRAVAASKMLRAQAQGGQMSASAESFVDRVIAGPAPAPTGAGPAPAPVTWDMIFPGIPGGGAQHLSEDSPDVKLGPKAPEFSTEQCGVETAGPICFGDEETGGQIILPAAVQPGLRGYWPFDQASALDVSGNKNHGYGTVAPGPAWGGQGSSAFFRRTYLEVPDSSATLRLADFSYTFWVYLIEDTPGGLLTCPLLRKGVGSSERFMGESGRTYDAAPAILYDRSSNRLRVEIITSGDGVPTLEAFMSNARIRSGRWVHVAVTRADRERRTRLYVNGILDASHETKGNLRPMEEPLYIGGDPLTREHCNLPMYIDELRVYDRAIEADEIEAEAAPALQGVEPSFVRLACVDCPLEVAQRLCPTHYHICGSLEMHMGGYQVAHSMGYLQPGMHVWTRSAAEALRQAKVAATRPGNTSGAAGEGPAGPGGEVGFAAGQSEPEPSPGIEGNPAASSSTWAGDVVRGAVVSLVQSEAGATPVAVANIPKLGLGLCCADA